MTSPRPLTESDMPSVRTWFALQQWPELPDWALSTTGFIVPGIAATWLYTMNSGIAWMEHLVANPLVDKVERREAIQTLIKHVEGIAREQGYKVILTISNHPGALRAYEEAGFSKGDANMVQYIRRL